METVKWLIHELDIHSGAGTVLSTLVLIIVTIFYAWKAKQQADETKKSRELQDKTLSHQIHSEQERNSETITKSARVIYADLLAGIYEILLNSQNKTREGYIENHKPQNIQYLRDYPVHLANLGNLFTSKDILRIKRLYGMLGQYSRVYLDMDFRRRRPDLWLIDVYNSALSFGKELFGRELESMDINLLVQQFDEIPIICSMVDEYGNLFDLLRKWSELPFD